MIGPVGAMKAQREQRATLWVAPDTVRGLLHTKNATSAEEHHRCLCIAYRHAVCIAHMAEACPVAR